MICRLKGVLENLSDNIALIDVSGVGYEVNVPPYTADILLPQLGQVVTIFTYHYIVGGNVGNGYPTLIGFGSVNDREFFERFITVSGIGPKAAVKALALPPSDVASAIEREDTKVLKSLPGIGERTAREIVATLKGKVSRFAIGDLNLPVSPTPRPTPVMTGALGDEAVAVLEQLGYRNAEAEKMVHEVMARLPGLVKVEDLIQEVYRQRTGAARP